MVQISRQHGRSAALRPFTLRRKATRQPPDSFRLTAAASHLPGLLLPNLGPQHGRHRRVAAAAAGALGPWEHRPEAQGLVARARDHRLTVRRHGQVQHLRTQQTHHQSAAEPPGPTALPAPPSLHPCTAAAAHWRAAGAGQAPGTPPPPPHTHTPLSTQAPPARPQPTHPVVVSRQRRQLGHGGVLPHHNLVLAVAVGGHNLVRVLAPRQAAHLQPSARRGERASSSGRGLNRPGSSDRAGVRSG